MNDIEKKNIRIVLENWAENCINTDYYPLLLIAMDNDKTTKLYWYGNYPPGHLAILLRNLADNMPLDYCGNPSIATHRYPEKE